MNDSLTLERPAPTRPPRRKAPDPSHGGAARPAEVVPLHDQPVRQAHVGDPSAVVIERLRVGAPGLLAHADQTTRSRLAQIVVKRLGSMIRNATSAFCLLVGEVASDASREDATALQDAALTIRPRSEDLVVEAARALSPAQLLALLAAASRDHDPTGIDALRCRHLVTSGVDALAREAMLDLESASGAVTEIVGRVVSSHIVGLFRSSGLLSAALLDALAERGQGAEAGRSKPSRLDDDGAVQNSLLRALASADHETAVPLLASAAGVSVGTVRAAIFLRTSKGLLSLGWRAGLDAADAATLQDTLGRLPPDETLRPTENGDFPLTGPEMLWQCRFLVRSQEVFAER